MEVVIQWISFSIEFGPWGVTMGCTVGAAGAATGAAS